MLKNKMLKLDHNMRVNFMNYFGIELVPTMFDGLFGLDVIALDAHLEVPDGTSTEQFIRENYGEDAVKLVYRLIYL